MFWCIGPTTIVDDENPSSAVLLRRASETNENSKGWNTIQVYFGESPPLPPSQKWFAQVHQDQVIVDLLGSSGYFIDLAANDAVEFSNTLALERDHGWKGLCIEPNPAYWYGLAANRRQCHIVGALVGGAQSQQVPVKFRGVFGGIVGKLDDKLANRKREPQAPEQTRYTAPFRELLQKFDVPHTIDYLSLDVEGAELLIMQEFPFDSYLVKVMTVERPGAELKALLQSKGYIFLKDLAWWGETLWAHKSTGFTPDHPKIQKIKAEERN